MEVETDPAVCAEVAARFEQCQQNVRWLEEHAMDAYSNRGKYICVSRQQIFVADTPEQAILAAKNAHPHDDGRFTLYIPVDKAPRIYACLLGRDITNHFALVVDNPANAVCLLSRGEVYHA